MRLYIKDTSGSSYQCDIEPSTTVGEIAADFFESMDWPQQDADGSGQRAVVEFLNPKTGKYIRLRQDQTLSDAGITDLTVLQILPEAIAGAVDIRRRLSALKIDYTEMEKLTLSYPEISFSAKNSDYPDDYEITFNCASFGYIPTKLGEMPEILELHKVNIHMNSEYPREAPILEWTTPIFHPNISSEGRVCLGQLNDRYLPNLGLNRIVLLLNEMIHWRNYSFFDPFNPDAAVWAMAEENWKYIEEIGGYKFNVPYPQLINPENWGDTKKENALFRGIEQPLHLKIRWLEDNVRPRIIFNRITQSAAQ